MVTVDLAQLEQMMARALVAAGTSPENAGRVAASLAEAEGVTIPAALYDDIGARAGGEATRA